MVDGSGGALRFAVLGPVRAWRAGVELGPPTQAIAWFDAAHPSLPGLVALATDTGLDTHVWHLAWASRHYLDTQGHWRDWLTMAHAALAAAERLADPTARAHSHRMLGLAYNTMDRNDDAETHLRHALHLFQALGDLSGQEGEQCRYADSPVSSQVPRSSSPP